MLVTKEQQEEWLNAYIKEGHSMDCCMGFIDGIDKALSYMQEQMKPQDNDLEQIRKQQGDLSEICYTC